MVSAAMTYSTAEDFKQPILQYNAKTKNWRLVRDYTFEWGPQGERQRLFMAAGFQYDKASVPQFLWAIARPDGPWEAAALFHDRFYMDRGQFPHPHLFRFETQGEDGVWTEDLSTWRRAHADNLLEYMGKLGGEVPWKARAYKLAVQAYPPNWFKGF